MTIEFQGGLLDGHTEDVEAYEWAEVQKLGFTGPDRNTVLPDAVYGRIGDTFIHDPTIQIAPGESARVVLLPKKFWNKPTP